MNPVNTYKSKLTTPDQAVNCIAAQGNIALSFGNTQPPALMQALAKRGKRGEIEKIYVYYLHSFEPARNTIFSDDLSEIFLPRPMTGLTAHDRHLLAKDLQAQKKRLSAVPCHFSDTSRLFRDNIALNTFLIMVSPMDNGGNFSMGTANAYHLSAAKNSKNVIVEVNKNMPRVSGQSTIHVSEVTTIVEHDSPIIESPVVASTDEDVKIAEYIINLIPDGATIQLGIGGIPNAVGSQLHGHKDLGIHTELFCESMVDLIERGVVTGWKKNINKGLHVFTVCMGSKRVYDFIHDNARIASYPVSYVNNVDVIASHDNFISINSALQVDLLGQVNAEFLDPHTFSGAGGQVDFVRGAQAANGGKSFIAIKSTAAKGKSSRIVPLVDKVVTDTRMDTQYVVTEHGIVNLKGKSISERAEALIQIAHPDFRDELYQQAKKLSIIF